jgi:hypothetical protein
MKKILILPGFLCLIFISCKKEKLNDQRDNRVTPVNRTLSNVRIINLGGFNQVIANGNRLTNFIYRDANDPDAGKYPGTDYFPKDGRLGTTWQVPQDLFDSTGSLALKFTLPGAGIHNPVLSLKGDKVQPLDYYLLPNMIIEGQPEYVQVERGVAAPSRPDYFKIRVINLCAKFNYPISSPRGQTEKLLGPVTLTYADGTPVSPQTSNVTLEKRVSDYVELPYGTYQFRLLTPDGRQFPGASQGEGLNIDPPTSTIATVRNNEVGSTNLTFASIVTFQPGGVYTVVVAPSSFNYNASPSEQTGGAVQNAPRIITDVNPGGNITYSRLQGVNALGNKQVMGLRVDGAVQATGLLFGQASAYGDYVQGNHVIEAIDASGKVLATTTQVLRAAQNYTAWLYPTLTGAPALVLVTNDLSGTRYSSVGTIDDPSGYLVLPDFFFNKRFLNLSPDNPYITFTQDNGKLIPEGNNLAFGQPLLVQPYSSGIYWQTAFELMAYRSSPNIVPGIWASDIPALKSQDFIMRKALYETAGRPLPDQEPGVYTVALIGRSGANVEASEKARMIIVKHTR